MPRTRAPSWGDISFIGTRLSTHRRRRGQAGLRDNTLSRTSYPDAAVAEGPEGTGGLRGEAWLRRPWAVAGPGCGARGWRRGLAAVPVGGGEAWLRCPWAVAGPGRTTSRRAEHTSAIRRRRCGGRRRDRRARAGFEAGPGCGAHGRWRGLAGQRVDAPSEACGADDSRAGRRPRRSQAPQQDQTAPGTPAEPQTQTQTGTQTRQSGPEPLGSGPPSMLSGDQRTTRVSSARPPCHPCRSSRR